MNLGDLQNLVKLGESKTLEFKKSIANLDAAGKALCGFLNQADGGIVLIGINNHGKFVGQEINDNVLKKIAAFVQRFEPKGRIECVYIDFSDQAKKIVLFKANPTTKERPYAYDGKYYERIESTTTLLSREEVRMLFLDSHDAYKIWGAKTSANYKLIDFDHDEIKKSIKQGVAANRLNEEAEKDSIENVLTKLKLIIDGQITNAAMVLFAKDAEVSLFQCSIKMARFRGNDKYGDFIDNQIFSGNAFQILRTAQDFVRKHLFIASRFPNDSFERIDEPTLPVYAVREALINAICHRNYRDSGTSISLAIYDDRMEIWNSGRLPIGWTLDTLKKPHDSEPRNELIAQMFYIRDFIEKWGRGIKTILNECEKVKLPEPEYAEYSNGVSITFKYKEPLVPARPRAIDEDVNISERQKEVLKILSKQKQIAVRDILASLLFPATDRTLRRDLSYLKKLGLANYTGKGRNVKWHLKK